MDNFFGTAPFAGVIEHEIIEKRVLYAQNSNRGGGWGHSLRMSTWSVINRESSQAHGFRINLFFMKVKNRLSCINCKLT